MRLSPRISFPKTVKVEYEGDLVNVQGIDLSLFAIKVKRKPNLSFEKGSSVVVSMDLDEEVSLSGEIKRENKEDVVLKFAEDPEVIAKTVGKYLTDKIFESKKCPYCGYSLDRIVEICPKCGMYLDFSKKEVIKIMQEMKIGSFISKMVEGKEEYTRFCVEESLEMVGTSEKMRNIFNLIRRYAATDYPVLILGETGTGKELTARAIHERSRRADKPFVVVNCAAIPADLLEAELFGYEKGAFTGADKRKIGRIEYAKGGTLFLDEIGDMPYDLQAKLLRFLQDYTFQRLGGNETIKADVRIISATNINLEEAVKIGSFRRDLYYRLSTLSIELPPLRERGEDVIILAKYFLKKYSEELNKDIIGFSEGALDLIRNYTWPGNVRELINVIRRACVLTDKEYIDVNDLNIKFENIEAKDLKAGILDLNKHVEALEKELLKKAFIISRGNVSKMASLLKISRPKVYKLMEKYDIGKVKY